MYVCPMRLLYQEDVNDVSVCLVNVLVLFLEAKRNSLCKRRCTCEGAGRWRGSQGGGSQLGGLIAHALAYKQHRREEQQEFLTISEQFREEARSDWTGRVSPRWSVHHRFVRIEVGPASIIVSRKASLRQSNLPPFD